MLLLLSQHNTAQHRSTDPQRKRAGKAAVGTNALHNSGGQAKIVCLHRWWANRGQTHSTALDATVADEVLVLFVATITIPQRWSDRQCTKPRHQHSIDTNHTPKTDSKHKTHTHTHTYRPQKNQSHMQYMHNCGVGRGPLYNTHTQRACVATTAAATTPAHHRNRRTYNRTVCYTQPAALSLSTTSTKKRCSQHATHHPAHLLLIILPQQLKPRTQQP